MQSILHAYVQRFNELDNETYTQLIPNSQAEAFLAENIPLLECPDKELEEIYYFRAYTFAKHLKVNRFNQVILVFLSE